MLEYIICMRITQESEYILEDIYTTAHRKITSTTYNFYRENGKCISYDTYRYIYTLYFISYIFTSYMAYNNI